MIIFDLITYTILQHEQQEVIKTQTAYLAFSYFYIVIRHTERQISSWEVFVKKKKILSRRRKQS